MRGLAGVPFLAVALGGALGASLRWSLEAQTALQSAALLLLVNLGGSVLLWGLLTRGSLSPRQLAFWGTGFCGSLTTVSALAGFSFVLESSGSLGALGAGLAAGGLWLMHLILSVPLLLLLEHWRRGGRRLR